MEKPTPMKTEQAVNGLYPDAAAVMSYLARTAAKCKLDLHAADSLADGFIKMNF
jgi:hypothetical protein